MTCCGSSSMEDSRRRQITSFSGIMWTEVSRAWRPSVCYSPTRSNTPKISLSCEETTSVLQSTVFTGFTMNASVDTISSCGRLLPTASTACLLQPLSTRKSLRCTVVCHLICRAWNRSAELCGQLMFQTLVCNLITHFPGLLCDLLWSDPDKDITGWSENDRGVSFTFGPDVVTRFLQKHDLDLICRAHQVVEDGYEFFAKVFIEI